MGVMRLLVIGRGIGVGGVCFVCECLSSLSLLHCAELIFAGADFGCVVGECTWRREWWTEFMLECGGGESVLGCGVFTLSPLVWLRVSASRTDMTGGTCCGRRWRGTARWLRGRSG